MPPQEIFGILDVLRSILVHFGTLAHYGKVHVQINYKILCCWYSRLSHGMSSRYAYTLIHVLCARAQNHANVPGLETESRERINPIHFRRSPSVQRCMVCRLVQNNSRYGCRNGRLLALKVLCGKLMIIIRSTCTQPKKGIFLAVRRIF